MSSHRGTRFSILHYISLYVPRLKISTYPCDAIETIIKILLRTVNIP